MKLPRRRFLQLTAGAAALPAVSRIAWAQAYPTRPTTTNVRARTPAEILAPSPELRIPDTAAQTRMVSANEFWPSQWE